MSWPLRIWMCCLIERAHWNGEDSGRIYLASLYSVDWLVGSGINNICTSDNYLVNASNFTLTTHILTYVYSNNTFTRSNNKPETTSSSLVV